MIEEIVHKGSYVGGTSVIDCDICGFAHIVPVPQPLGDYYNADRYAHHERGHLTRYMEEKEDQAWYDMQWEERLNAIEEWTDKGKILDIGSGHGWFMQYATRRGWVCHGVEPAIVDRSTYSEIGDVPVGAEFDAIHCSFVLEHLSDPIHMLGRIHELLKAGGVFCVAVPNDRRLVPAGWVVRDEHINYFSHESIDNLLWRSGFIPVESWASFPMDWFNRVPGLDYRDNPSLGHKLHHIRMTFELGLQRLGLNGLKLSLYRWLIQHDQGRSSIVVARRASA